MGSTATHTTLPLTALEVGKINPRKVRAHDRVGIQELADSIAIYGILQPLIVRKTASGYEILAGRRRYEAAKKAGLTEVPVEIREADDSAALDIGIIENVHRQALDPLDEAAAIATRLAGGQSIPQVAAAIGKSPAYVARRSNLRMLHADLTESLKNPDGFLRTWPVAAIEQLALLEPGEQVRLIEQEGWDVTPPTVALIHDLIGRSLRILRTAPWKLDDENLVPAAGPCSTCPWNSDHCKDLFGDFAPDGEKHPDAICRNEGCFSKKLEAWRDQRLAEELEKHGTDLVLVQGEYNAGDPSVTDGLRMPAGRRALHVGDYEKAKKGAQGAVPGFVVNRKGAGSLIWVKARKAGTSKGKQSKAAPPAANSQEQYAHLKDRMERRRQMIVVDGVRDLLGKLEAPEAAVLIGFVHAYGAPRPGTLAESFKDRKADFDERSGSVLWAWVRGEIDAQLTRSEARDVEKQYEEAEWICLKLDAGEDFDVLVENAKEAVPESRAMKKMREEFDREEAGEGEGE